MRCSVWTSRNRTARFFSTTAGVAIACSACGPGVPVEHGPTKAIIQDVSGWSSAGMNGHLDTPLFPISLLYPDTLITFAGVVTGNHWSQYPHPWTDLEIKFFGSNGVFPPQGTFDEWFNETSRHESHWYEDPAYPGKLTSKPDGNYRAGADGITVRKDLLYAQQRLLWQDGTTTKALGRGDLPWKYTSQSANIIGSHSVVPKDTPIWIQATADLPLPISYAWTVDFEPMSWSTGFVTTSFPEIGDRDIQVTMTGANNVQVQRSWVVSVTCPPPYEPWELYCP